jgi:hypothetical protein
MSDPLCSNNVKYGGLNIYYICILNVSYFIFLMKGVSYFIFLMYLEPRINSWKEIRKKSWVITHIFD